MVEIISASVSQHFLLKLLIIVFLSTVCADLHAWTLPVLFQILSLGTTEETEQFCWLLDRVSFSFCELCGYSFGVSNTSYHLSTSNHILKKEIACKVNVNIQLK